MMSRATLLDRYSDYFLLVKPRPAGARIGSYNGDPIPAAVVDEFGRRYVYVGLAPRRAVRRILPSLGESARATALS